MLALLALPGAAAANAPFSAGAEAWPDNNTGALPLSASECQMLSRSVDILNQEAQQYLAVLHRVDAVLRSVESIDAMDEATLRRYLSARQFALNELYVLQFRHRQALLTEFTAEQLALFAPAGDRPGEAPRACTG